MGKSNCKGDAVKGEALEGRGVVLLRGKNNENGKKGLISSTEGWKGNRRENGVKNANTIEGRMGDSYPFLITLALII